MLRTPGQLSFIGLFCAAACLQLALCAEGRAQVQGLISGWTFDALPPPPHSGSNRMPILSDSGFVEGIARGFHANPTTFWFPPSGNGTPFSLAADKWAVNDYFEFRTSTVGYEGIGLTFDAFSSPDGPRDFSVQYRSGLSGPFIPTGITYSLQPTDFWTPEFPNPISSYEFDLSAITALNDQEDVFIRLVMSSTSSVLGPPVSPGGTSWIDSVMIYGGEEGPGDDLPEIKQWIQPGSGVFGVGSNWDTGTPPDANDTAVFDLPNQSVTVDFNTGASSLDMQLRNGNVTFDLNGHTYDLTDDSAVWGYLEVGYFDGDNGELTITGGGLLLNTEGSIGWSGGAQGAVMVSGDNSTWWNSASLTVGDEGTGEITVADGGLVHGTNTLIGLESGSEGLVTVTGEGSRFQGYTIRVGFRGNGTLRVENGATVDAGDFFASLNSLEGDGTIYADSVVLDDMDLFFDSTHGLQQTFGFGDGGQLYLNKNNFGTVGAGHAGTGTLTIADGFTLNSEVGMFGWLSGSDGSGTVTGGSTWTMTYRLDVGFLGEGELTIEAGGKVYSGGSAGSSIGGTDWFESHSGVGSVTVNGQGSAWTNSSVLTVGYLGHGELHVENGGAVSNTDGYLGRGNHANSNGVVTVTGSGSTWTNTGNLVLSGSSLTTSTSGDSSLTVSSGGTVQVGGTLRVHSGGTVNLQTGGTIHTQHFNPTGGTFNFTGGTLAITGNFTGDLNVPQQGTLKGDGTVLGNLVNAGRVAPGFSPEIIHVDGDYTQTSTGRLEIEIGGLTPGTQHDQLQVTGNAALAGQLRVSLINGFQPALNDEVIAIEAATVTGKFSRIVPPVLDPQDNLAVSYIYNSGDMRIRFVDADNTIQFVRNTQGTTNWADATNWTGGVVPSSPNVVDLQNLAAAGVQRLEVVASALPDSESAFVHSAVVEGTTSDDMTLAVYSSFSATTTLTAASNGIIELNSGDIAATTVNVEGGGLLTGEGTIHADLVVGGGTGEATISPSLSGSGHIEVQNDYQQQANGTMRIDIESENQFDTIAVAGSAVLGGALVIEAASYTAAGTATTEFEIVTTGGLSGEFAAVEWSGNNDIWFMPDYDYLDGAVRIVQGARGDMNGDGLIDTLDIDLFVFALLSGSEFRFLQKSIELCDANERFCELPSSQAGGDWDGSGIVDFDDIPYFQDVAVGNGLGSTALSAGFERYFSTLPAVPEPASALLIGGCVAHVAGVRCRRRPIKARFAQEYPLSRKRL